MRAPTNNRITQGQHLASKAVDHSASPDPYVYAPESGKIDSYQWRGTGNNSAGNVLRLAGKTGMHSFCHLETSYVKPGQQVSEGQKIAKMGYTGYTIPSGPAGRHLHYYVRTPKGYVYPPTLYKAPAGGEVTTLTTARILAYHILGRITGKNNALAGHSDADLNKNHVGKDTNAKIIEFYNSPEGKSWREKTLPTLMRKAAERDALAKQRDELKAALANEQKKPPKEVVKEIEKIVEVPVEVVKEVEVAPPVLVKIRDFFKELLGL